MRTYVLIIVMALCAIGAVNAQNTGVSPFVTAQSDEITTSNTTEDASLLAYEGLIDKQWVHLVPDTVYLRVLTSSVATWHDANVEKIITRLEHYGLELSTFDVEFYSEGKNLVYYVKSWGATRLFTKSIMNNYDQDYKKVKFIDIRTHRMAEFNNFTKPDIQY